MDESRSMLPLVEGKCPPERRLVNIDGKWEWETFYPEPDEDYEDPEIYETETYSQEDKDEFYDYVTRCKKCWTEFIAYDKNGERTMKYCPECGARLAEEQGNA